MKQTTKITNMVHCSKPSVPFLFAHIDRIDLAAYQQDLLDATALGDSYDPVTQTSRLSVYAGTSRTYRDTYSGVLGHTTDDARVNDG